MNDVSMNAVPMSAAMPSRGFTLIEMLVAIAILAVIAIIGWRGLDGIVRARDAVTSEIQRQRGLQAAFAQLESDLRLVVRDPADASTLPGIRFANGDIQVLRQAPSASDGRLRYQLVRWQLVEGRYVRRVRAVQTPDEARALAAAAEWPGATEQTLVGGLTSVSTRLWSGGAWQPPVGPAADALARAQALAAPGPQPPAAVEIVLTTQDGEQFRRAVLVRE